MPLGFSATGIAKMADVVDAATRSRMMAGIQGKNTKPEIAVRKGLHRMGLRFRLDGSALPGRPDMVLAKHRTVVFIHGCFWHAHACSAFHLPASNAAFWQEKLHKNVVRDCMRVNELRALDWRVLVIWECATRITSEKNNTYLYQIARDWIVNYDSGYLEIYRGKSNGISKRRTTARAL
jgi:DNA mismatch endonuclease (patch repair protein)